MEPFNKSMKNIIQFVLCIQDSCDKHRKYMEHLWLQEYTSYVTEWKQREAEFKLQIEKKNEATLCKASKSLDVHSDCNLDELGELALADSLLRKARNIRIKNQKLISGLVDCTDISTNTDTSALAMNSNATQTSGRNRIRKKMSHSRSDIIINSHRSIIVPRSKSATIPLIQKKDSESFHNTKSCTVLTSNHNDMNHTKDTNKASKDLSVISSKDLDMLKKLHVNHPTCHESNGKIVPTSSDESENIKQHKTSLYPSSREFINLLKSRLNGVSSRIKLKIWYPFLSSKSEASLSRINYDNFCSLKKMYSVLCSIQETMMWIDLLYLIETDICPTLVFDPCDV